MNEVEKKVIAWANDRNLLEGTTALKQMEKLWEECQELWTEVAYVEDGFDSVLDAKKELGDCLVVLTMIANQLDSSLEECYTLAYEKIKDRKGRMINGLFVREKS